MNAATAVHYSQPLQPPTATAGERVTRPLLPLPPPPLMTTSSDNKDDDDDYDDNTTPTKPPTSPTTYRSLTHDTHRGRGVWSQTGRQLHWQRNKDHGEKLGLS
jgi:hypothetical protein